MKKINLVISDEADAVFRQIQQKNNIKTRDEALDKILKNIDEDIELDKE